MSNIKDIRKLINLVEGEVVDFTRARIKKRNRDQPEEFKHWMAGVKHQLNSNLNAPMELLNNFVMTGSCNQLNDFMSEWINSFQHNFADDLYAQIDQQKELLSNSKFIALSNAWEEKCGFSFLGELQDMLKDNLQDQEDDLESGVYNNNE